MDGRHQRLPFSTEDFLVSEGCGAMRHSAPHANYLMSTLVGESRLRRLLTCVDRGSISGSGMGYSVFVLCHLVQRVSIYSIYLICTNEAIH